ncbi:class A beta-lactamase [Reichenbachiella ulvae]|uniref:beta-lactamase n=1 Tax=Reichenbachiella ulvae TaxID=2980104 RepID=A0ABT3CRV6_9BACT|nr:class A beta-lactamase [Reichenbachiella ulvae]MCV9386288.1 class A beta-lactamase [Reichenbachiella ulvae]
MKLRSSIFIMVFILTSGFTAFGQDTQRVSEALGNVSEGLVGYIGVAAQDLKTGKQVFLNGDDPFPMASTYKIAIAVTLLSKVESGELSLTKIIEIKDEEWVLSDIIASNFIHQGVALSLANIMEVMITHSDNTATNVALRLAGGPAAVNDHMKQLGIKGMHMDRTTSDYSRDFYGQEPGRENMKEAIKNLSADPAIANDPQSEFEADSKDKSTPRAMLNLLTMIYEGKVINNENTAFLLGIMSRTVTGPNRLRGLLPGETPVAHKTGTLGGIANDVGYITLPDGHRFAIVVFTRGSATPQSDRDRAIAEVSRTLYDYFVLISE